MMNQEFAGVLLHDRRQSVLEIGRITRQRKRAARITARMSAPAPVARLRDRRPPVPAVRPLV